MHAFKTGGFSRQKNEHFSRSLLSAPSPFGASAAAQSLVIVTQARIGANRTVQRDRSTACSLTHTLSLFLFLPFLCLFHSLSSLLRLSFHRISLSCCDQCLAIFSLVFVSPRAFPAVSYGFFHITPLRSFPPKISVAPLSPLSFL